MARLTSKSARLHDPSDIQWIFRSSERRKQIFLSGMNRRVDSSPYPHSNQPDTSNDNWKQRSLFRFAFFSDFFESGWGRNLMRLPKKGIDKEGSSLFDGDRQSTEARVESICEPAHDSSAQESVRIHLGCTTVPELNCWRNT